MNGMKCIWAVAAALLTTVVPANGQSVPRPSPSGISLVSGITGNGDNAYLTDVHIARLTSSGTVLAYDLMSLSVMEFGFDGSLIRRLGREGGGPGEFRRIDDMGVWGDSVWVKDLQQRRITWFEDGQLLGTQRMGDSTLAMDPFTFVGQDQMVVFSWGVPDQSQVVARLMTHDGEEIDSLMSVPRGENTSVPIVLFGRQNRAINVFADRPIRQHSVNGDGVVVVQRPRPETEDRAEFRVVRFFRGNTTERRFTTSPHPLSDYESNRLEEIIDALYEQIGRRIGTRRSEIAEVYADALGSPEFGLPVYEARIEDNGRVWLATWPHDGSMEWLWLDESLHVAGAVRIPRNMKVFDVNNGMILTEVLDEWDVPSLCIYVVEEIRPSHLGPSGEAPQPPACIQHYP